MNVSVIVATYGEYKWMHLAQERALPSIEANINVQVVEHHAPLDTLAHVRNTAASRATGDWLCFLDADDELEPGYLNAMAKTYAQCLSKSPLLVPAVRFVRPYRGLLVDVNARAEIPNRGGWPKVNECVVGTLVKRDLFEAVGGFRELTDNGERILMYEDWDLWLRCWNSGSQLVYVEDAVYRAHVSDDGRNTNAHLAQTAYDAIWRDHETDTEVLGRVP